MSLPVVLTPEAEADLEEAAQWYERRAEGLGKDLVVRVRDLLQRIRATPQMFPEVAAGVRRGPVKRFPYSVFYRDRPERIEVVCVFHNRRDQPSGRGEHRLNDRLRQIVVDPEPNTGLSALP